MESKKTAVITFRVTPKEQAWLEKQAAARNWTVSHFCSWFFFSALDIVFPAGGGT